MRLMIFLFFMLVASAAQAGSNADIDQFIGSRHVVAQVYFAKQATELTEAAMQKLDSLGDQLQKYNLQEMLIRIEGFASPEGENQYNMKLSLQRALAVEAYLLKKHKLEAYVFLTGFGENLGSDGKLTELRRVDIAVYTKNRAAEVLFNETAKVERFILK